MLYILTKPFKLDVGNYMIEHGSSLNETAGVFKIAAPSTIHVWKKQFKKKGIVAFNRKKRGVHFGKEIQIKPSKQGVVEDTIETLQAEIERPRMENEYLKKLNTLVQAKEKSPKKTK